MHMAEDQSKAVIALSSSADLFDPSHANLVSRLRALGEFVSNANDMRCQLKESTNALS
jgi:hypothetical protein